MRLGWRVVSDVNPRDGISDDVSEGEIFRKWENSVRYSKVRLSEGEIVQRLVSVGRLCPKDEDPKVGARRQTLSEGRRSDSV